MSKSKWYEVESAEVANGTVTKGDHVAVAVGDGRYGGGLRLGYVETVEAKDYEWRGRAWADLDDPRPELLKYGSAEPFRHPETGQKLVDVGPETRQHHQVKVRVTNDCGESKNYSKVYPYPQRIALLIPSAQED